MSSKYPPRYKPSGLQMIPTPCYDVLSREPKPGKAWVYWVPGGIVALISDDDKILTCTDKKIRDLEVHAYTAQMQDFILDCAAEGLSVPEALVKIQERFGEPGIELALADINKPYIEIRDAVTSLV